MANLREQAIASDTILLRRHAGANRVFGARCLTIGNPGVSDVWVAWEWDGHGFTLKTDRFGLIPVYTAQIGADFAVSLDLQSLLALGVPSSLDEEAVAVQLRIGSYLSESTPFRHIRALPAGAVLEWRDGRISLRTEIRWPSPDLSISRDSAIRHYAEIFRDAVARRAARAARIVLPLSGGLDSTHILLALNEIGGRPEMCVTVADEFSDNTADILGAAITAKRIGIPHRVLKQRARLGEASRWVADTMGLRVTQHHWAKPLSVFLGECENVQFFDGIAGDNLSASSFISRTWARLAERGRTLDLADAFIARSDADAWWRDHGQPTITRRFTVEAARHAIATELERHLDCANPVGRFMFMNRLRTLIAPLPSVALRPHAEPMFPFLDHAVFDFLASLPVGYLFDKKFHRDAIANAYGEQWPPRVPARSRWRLSARRIGNWGESVVQNLRGRWRLDASLRQPQTFLNPIRWAFNDYPYSVLFSALYMQNLLAAETQTAPRVREHHRTALEPGWV